MQDKTFQFIECCGTPREMGQQYGEQARDGIRANVERCQPGGAKRFHKEYAQSARALLAQNAEDVLEELKGLAEGSGVPLEMLILENATGTPLSPQCTSMAIPSSPDGAILGKNNDGAVDERCWVVRRTKPARGLAMIQVVSAGWLSGLDAMNAAGLANAENSVGSSLHRLPGSLEIRLWTYHLMQRCSTIPEFVGGLNVIPLNGKGFNVVAADAKGNACVLECAVPKVMLRGNGEPFLYATNHYVIDELANADKRTPDQKRISLCRFDYLKWQEQMSRPRTKGDIRRLLKSHESWAPCRHGQAHESHTLWSIIAVPEQRRMDVACGPPCKCEYSRYQL